MQRAYARAGFGPESVGYFEGHGTGTVVGDTTELGALTRLLREAPARSGVLEPTPIGSIKANNRPHESGCGCCRTDQGRNGGAPTNRARHAGLRASA